MNGVHYRLTDVHGIREHHTLWCDTPQEAWQEAQRLFKAGYYVWVESVKVS